MKTIRTILASALALALCGCSSVTGGDSYDIFVGTYGNAIHRYTITPGSGQFTETQTIPARDPSYIALTQDGKLYAVSECGPESGVYSFAQGQDGAWTMTAHLQETAEDPCFIYPLGGKVLTADYTGGELSSFSTEGGAVSAKSQGIAFEYVYSESSPNPRRQEKPHIHQVKPLPKSICEAGGIHGTWLMVNDLGNDRIHVMEFTAEGQVQPEAVTIECGVGAGPRHSEFNEDKCMLYNLTELSGEIIAWKIAGQDGKPSFTEVQRIKADEVEAGGSADIHLSPDGRFLYASHRLENDGISIYEVAEDGTLVRAGYQNTGIHPRNFAITPDGKYLIAACRDSASIEVYSINATDGLLSSVCSYVLKEDKPTCIVFAD